MEQMTYEGGAVIYNPTSGRGTGGERYKEAQGFLGDKFEFIPTRHAGHAEELAREAAKKHPIVVAMGGDGTVSDVVRGIYGSEATLGVIPVGTGNDFARNIGLKMELRECVSTILGGAVRRIDIGTINDIPFANNCGTGFDSQVMKTMNEGIRFAKGALAFNLAILKTLPTFPPFTLNMEYESSEGTQTISEKALMISVLNGKMYAAGMIAAPHADMDDGHLDVLIIRAVPKIQLIPLIQQVRAGTHLGHPAVRMLKVRSFTMQTIPALPLNVDGDLKGLTPAKVETKLNALKVLVR